MPPVNNNVANAIVITGGTQTISGDSTGANSETPGELAWNGADTATVWYRWTNAGASPAIVQLSTATVGGGNWPNGIEVDAYWTFTGTATNWANLDAHAFDFDWNAWIDDTPPTNSVATRVVPAGKTVYLSVRDKDWTPNGYGPFTFKFKFTVYEDFTGNDAFANAHLLTTLVGAGTGDNTSATSDGANDPLDTYWGYGSHTVWFRLPTSTSYRLVTYEIQNFNAWNARMAIFKGASLATLTIDGDGVVYQVNNGAIVDILIGPGSDYYFELTGRLNSDYGAYTFLWTIVELPPAPAPDPVGPGIELKSPGANFTEYSGNAIAVRASSYPGGVRGTLAEVSDSTSPSLTHLSETQLVTGITYATYNTYTPPVASAAVTVAVNMETIGCKLRVSYQVHVLLKTVGTTPDALTKTRESFFFRTCSRMAWSFNGGGYNLTAGEMPNNCEHQWLFKYVTTTTIQSSGADNTLRLKLFGINTAGVDIRIAQLVFIPISASLPNDLDLTNSDLDSRYYFNIFSTTDASVQPDTFTDALGSRSMDNLMGYDGSGGGVADARGTTFNVELDWVDYQDVSSSNAEANVTDVAPIDWTQYYTSHAWTMACAVWYPTKTLVDENFARTLPAVANYHWFFDYTDPTYSATWNQGFGRTTYGYVWSASQMWIDNQSHEWGYNGFYGAAQKSWIEVDGSAAVIVCGGYDTGLRGIRAKLSDNSGYGINIAVENPPHLRDVVDYVIEGVFSTVGTLDSDTVAEIGKIGKMRYQGGDDCIALILEWQPDGSLEARIQVESPNKVGSNYLIDGPIVFDAGVYTGAKIHMKISRQRCVIKGKIWYDGDAEPGWQLEGTMPGFTYTSNSNGPYTWRDHPYTQVGGSHYLADGFNWQWFDNGEPFFSSSVAKEQIVPTDNGGQYNSVQFKWDNYKVSYDPDGDVTKDAHLMIKNGATTWVSDTTISRERQGFYYLGRRAWLPPGQTWFTWVTSGSAVLFGASSQIIIWQKVKTIVVAITGNISMRWKQGRSQ